MISIGKTRIDQPKDRSGFTIVELLIAIIVLGALVGVTMAFFTGAQKRTQTAEAETAGTTVIAKAEAVYAATSRYPTAIDGANGFSSIPEASLKGSGISLGEIGSSSSKSQTVSYGSCGSGARVSWWNYETNNRVERILGAGCATYGPVIGNP